MIKLALMLEREGWISARITDREMEVEISSSFLSDALKDLLTSVLLLAEGAPEARCRWQEEPGEYRWFSAMIGNH